MRCFGPVTLGSWRERMWRSVEGGSWDTRPTRRGERFAHPASRQSGHAARSREAVGEQIEIGDDAVGRPELGADTAIDARADTRVRRLDVGRATRGKRGRQVDALVRAGVAQLGANRIDLRIAVAPE